MKVNAPTAAAVTFETLASLVGAQVFKGKALGQRSHTGRIAAGKAQHTQAQRLGMKVPTTQALIQVACVKVGNKKPVTKLIDGYHRITEWLEHGCPFAALILVTHEIKALTQVEAEDAVDTLMRTIDGKAAVKGAADFYTGAIEDAGVKVTSKAYHQGVNALSFFKRVIGAHELPARMLKDNIARNKSVHESLDQLYAYVENRRVMKAADAKRVFHPGIAETIFNYMAVHGASPAKVVTLTEALAIASETPVSPGQKWSVVGRAIGERIRLLSSVTETTRLKAGRNVEQYYTAYGKELAEILPLLEKV